MKDPDAGRRLRDFVMTRRTDAEVWDDFARQVGVTRSALFSWFAGAEPSMGSLRALGTVLGVPRWELVRCWDGN